MSDEDTTIAQLKDLQAHFVAERDWSRFHSPKNLAMAISIEAAELLELFLWVDDAGSQVEGARAGPARGDVEAELADVALCLMSLCNTLGVDLSEAMRRKVAANAAKYPAVIVRGRAEKYHEIHHAGRTSALTRGDGPGGEDPEGE